MKNRVRLAAVPAAVLIATLTMACRQDMHDQPRYEPFEGNSFFDDGRFFFAIVRIDNQYRVARFRQPLAHDSKRRP